MAASLSPSESRRTEGMSRSTSSQTVPERGEQKREERRSSSRVKVRPANPLVISSILDSLDTLGNSPTDHTSFSGSTSERSRPRSVHSGIRSLHTIERSVSPGFGVEYGTGIAMDEGDDVPDAALPPTIRTSRPPSGMSNYTATRSPSYTGTNPAQPIRTPSLRSRRSSYSSMGKEKTGYSKNKLSAESWVKQNSLSHESFESTSTRETGSMRSVRRMRSHDSLRRMSTRIEIVEEDAAEGPVVSRAEQIIAKATTPPVSSSKRRLYLTDSGSEEQSITTPAPIEETPEAEDSAPSSLPTPSITPAETPISENRSSHRNSPRKSIIADSVPMRTSSLHQSQTSTPGRKKKDRKSKRSPEKTERSSKKDKSEKEYSKSEGGAGEGKVDSVMGAAPKKIPESSWADLGEEDETVKRIRELQEQRKSRLLESQSIVPPKVVNTTANQTPVTPNIDVARKSEESKRAARMRPDTLRSVTEPPVKAHKILGITETKPPPSRGQDAHGRADVNGFIRRRNLSLDEKQLQARPMTSSAPTPPLSLDYSYADAVDALQGAEREPKKEQNERPTHRRNTSAREPEQLPNILKQYPGTQVRLVPTENQAPDTVSLRLTKSQRKKQQDRWTHYHPDLPLDFDKKKNRRKSTSDARNTRYASPEPEPPVPRRDSIEVAVTDYLQSARLSRKIKHPVTGRVISFSEVGDPSGAAVFICVGMGLTRYVTAFYDELATTLRLRLITVDRPGVGGSEPYPATDRSGPLNWPDDVWTICQSLGITKFSMLAHSAGAIYALATALVMPQNIHGKIHLLAPWIPPSQLGAVPHSTTSAPPAGALPRSQRLLRVLPTPFLRAANSSFMTATSASLKPAAKRTKSHNYAESPTSPVRSKARPSTRDGAATALTPADLNRRESMMLMDQFMPDLNPMENYPIPLTSKNGAPLSRKPSAVIMSATATPMDPSFEFASSALNAAEHTEKERKTLYTTHLTQRTWELAVRDSNPATDLLVCLERHRDVGFRYTDVSREVVVTHGSEDKRVPLANVKWLAGQMDRRSKVNGGAGPPSRDSMADPSAMGGCELRILAGEGHGLMASPVIMGDCLTEIAGYWKTR
ncbi:uncharacterized protein LTR77_006536 [Saxophila tyrrhenica]|uniref:AB hydrolase-1 domain-containing protein n=1 Tax=Saxophila tyrrhenica TaxID=1690608 RepID=A0AAV9P527_9PEZI|nr:hypothetical protein LTR77_006536 [Saxophila tyrrhenica]